MFNYIPEVASATWKDVMSELCNSHYRKLHTYATVDIQYRLESYRKVLFVREPVARLLATYRNKFRNFESMQKTWENMYGKTIVKNYRKGSAQLDLKKWTKNSTLPDTFLNITLSEFIQFVVDNGDLIPMHEISDHFLPTNEVASPCAIHYDFIGHFENLTTEAPNMFRFLGIDHAVRLPEFRASKVVQVLIDQKVPFYLLKRLQHFYRKDYELFGYSVDDIFKSIVESSFNNRNNDGTIY